MKRHIHPKKLLQTRVFPLLITTPFAVGDVFSYLIKDEKKVLVDCAHLASSSYRQVKKQMTQAGVSIEELDEIWLTHGHPDHYGQAARLAKESGAVLKGHRKERANFAANSDRHRFRIFFEEHAIPVRVVEEMLGQLDWLQQFQEAIEPEWIAEGDQLCSGELTFTVKHTPGHAPGHVVFYSDEGLLFGGDVLLEHISTNALINFDPETGERNKSLLQYRNSLGWIKSQEGLVLPGHGKQINDIEKVANHHLAEHHERFKKIKGLLHENPKTLMALSEILFPDALKKNAHFLVFSEIIGYLDWGIETGEIAAEGNNFYIIE